jgi:hypothetical protein
MLPPTHATAEPTLVRELVELFLAEGFQIHGAIGLSDYPTSPYIRNNGYGSGADHQPHAVAFNAKEHRIIFGLVRPDRASLDTESSLEEYNVFLDHNAERQGQESMLYVLLPPAFLQEFTSLITHYIHRDYWWRVVPVVSRIINP